MLRRERPCVLKQQSDGHLSFLFGPLQHLANHGRIYAFSIHTMRNQYHDSFHRESAHLQFYILFPPLLPCRVWDPLLALGETSSPNPVMICSSPQIFLSTLPSIHTPPHHFPPTPTPAILVQWFRASLRSCQLRREAGFCAASRRRGTFLFACTPCGDCGRARWGQPKGVSNSAALLGSLQHMSPPR